MPLGGSIAGLLSYQDPGLAATSLAGQSGDLGNAPQATTAEGLGQFIGNAAKSVAGIGAGVFKGVMAPLLQAGHTLAEIPIQAVHNSISLGKETSALLTNNRTAYLNAANQAKTYQENSYIGKEYGTGNLVHDLGNAAVLGGTLATLGAPALGGFAKTGLPLADRLIDNTSGLIGAGKGNILTKTVRNALLTQPTLQFAGKTADDLAKGNVKSAALDAAMWGLPAAAHGALNLAKSGAGAVGNALFGKSAILNDIFSPEVVSQYAKSHPEDVNTLKQIEQFTLNQKHVQGNIDLAAPWLKNYLESTIPGVSGDANGLAKLITTFKPYAQELQRLQELQSKGAVIDGVPSQALTVSHNYVANIPKATDAIDRAIQDPKWSQDLQYRVQQTKQAVGSLGIADETLNAQISDAILNSNSPAEVKANLDDVMRAGQKQIVKDLGNGFIYTSAPDYVANMPSAEEVAGNTLAQGKSPSLPGVGRLIEKAGLSPNATPNGELESRLTDNLDRRLEELNVGTSGKEFLNMLRDKSKTALGVSDMRMLTSKEIKEAVRGNSELKEVPPKILAGAIRGAYRDLPAELTGAGPKLTNAVMNPLLAGYLRAQGVGRFELNPFFRGIKVPLKGGIVAAAHGAEVDDMAKAYLGLSKDTERTLESDPGGWYLSSSKAGESGTYAENNIVGTGKEVGRTVRSQITGLVESVAKANGTTPEAIIAEKGDLYNELQKGVSLIKGYGTGGYLNSPLAKTLNLLIFPSRFDTKVVQSAAKLMGRMTPLQQVAVVHAGAQFAGFLQSDEGHQWVQQNAEALQLLTYFSPVGTFQNVVNFFAKGQHVQDLGEIGGLPFGIITTMLTHQVPSLGHLGASQYVDLKTGQPVPSAIPITLQARAQTALTDIISSMFSYPGATVGLGSKTKTIQAAVPALKPAAGSVQYTFANGATEGSPNAPTGNAPAAAPVPQLPAAPPAPAVPQGPGEVRQATTSAAPRSRAARPKSIPASQQLPGSAAF